MELVKITADTIEDIKESLKAMKTDQTNLRIRGSAGWGGMSFNLVLDEPAERDLVEEHDGINFVVQKSLHDMYQGFAINSVKRNGFTYYSIMPGKQDSAAGCGGCTSCG